MKMISPRNGQKILLDGDEILSRIIELGMKIYDYHDLKYDANGKTIVFSHGATIFEANQKLLDVIEKKKKTFLGRMYLKRYVKGNVQLGCACVAEMLGQGFTIETWEESGYTEKDNYVLMEKKIPFSDEELEKISDKAAEYLDEFIPYEYTNFISYAGKIVTGAIFDLFNKSHTNKNGVSIWLPGERVQYCTENLARLDNASGRNDFPDPEQTSPMDVFDNASLKISDNSPMKI